MQRHQLDLWDRDEELRTSFIFLRQTSLIMCPAEDFLTSSILVHLITLLHKLLKSFTHYILTFFFSKFLLSSSYFFSKLTELPVSRMST